MSSCAVKICKNYPKKKNKSHGNITYHVFPKDDEIKRKWIDATGRNENWFPTSKSTICSEHFESDCFLENKERILLKQGSIPTLKLVETKHKKRSTRTKILKKTSRPTKEQSPTKEINIKDFQDDPASYRNDSSDSQIKKLIREKEYFKSVAEKRKLIIKAAKQRNRRLLKKIALLQVLLQRQRDKKLRTDEKETRKLATPANDPDGFGNW